MTMALAEKTCVPCRGGDPPLEREQAEAFLANVQDWDLCDDAHRIERHFLFANFREALNFVTAVSELADAEGHHPDVSFGWGYATVSLHTKKIKGLHENDFIIAAKIDRLFDPLSKPMSRAYGPSRSRHCDKWPELIFFVTGARSAFSLSITRLFIWPPMSCWIMGSIGRRSGATFVSGPM